MRFSRQECWSGLPFPSPGELPNPGTEPSLPHGRQMLYHLSHQGTKSQRTETFELWCWRRLLRVSWTEKRSNQVILKEINHKYSLERLIMKLKLQYFGHLMQRGGKDPDAEKDWGKEEKGTLEDEMVGRHHQFNGYEFEQTLRDSERQRGPVAVVHEVAKRWTRLSNWTTEQQLSLEPLFRDIRVLQKTLL